MKRWLRWVLSITLGLASLQGTLPQMDVQAEDYVSFTIGDFSAIYEAVRQGVVTVYNYSTTSVRNVESLESLGSGFVFFETESYQYILTNHHVVDKGLGFNVITDDFRQLEAQLIGADDLMDVAVLRVPRSSYLKVLPMGNSDDVKVGEEVMAVGNPLSIKLKGTGTLGLIAGIRRNLYVGQNDLTKLTQMIQIEATVNPGNSGGPLFNALGQVIGINTMAYITDENGTDQEALNFSIPINYALVVARQILEKGSFTPTTLGAVIYRDITTLKLTERNEWRVPSGVQSGVMMQPGNTSELYKAGITDYALLISANDQPLGDVYQFRSWLYNQPINSNVTIKALVYQSSTQTYLEMTVTVTVKAA